MSAREEKREAFNEQMNAWVSRQGLWFQLRHAADGQTIVGRAMRLLSRLAILLVIAALGLWFYLSKRAESDGLRENIRLSLEDTLRAKETDLGGLRKKRGELTIAYAKIEGGEDSFFHQLEARTIRTSMALTDGLIGTWDGKGVFIDRLDINLKAGGNDDTSAAKSFESLFPEQEGFKFERFESNSANLTWGYSAQNRGSIQNSHLTAAREDDGWRLEFRGGTFGQNWLSHLMINKMVVLCTPKGVIIKEAEMTSDDGTGLVSFSAEIGSGGQPAISGQLELKSMPVSSLLTPAYLDTVDGTISGVGKISGSTNSQEGVVLDIDFSFKEGDVLVMRDTLPLLSALSVLDAYNSYRKVSFNEGSFNVKTAADKLSVSQIKLKAGELLHMSGGFEFQPPTHAEIAKALNIRDVEKIRNILEKNWQRQDDVIEDTQTGESLSKRGEVKLESVRGTKVTPEEALENVLATAIFTELSVRRFDGSVKLGLKPDAFEKTTKLKETYPVDTETGRISLEVPLKGRFQTLTLSQAKELYLLGRKRE
ncbi:hypothetical protein NT6N_05770 [Oceaniferula spumae]|uniref:DUF3971 domain-containing protein n=1 Tax=Oceaniferula spumae TaxID=2979115 RepID=A0AAT9FHT8_9BACT